MLDRAGAVRRGWAASSPGAILAVLPRGRCPGGRPRGGASRAPGRMAWVSRV